MTKDERQQAILLSWIQGGCRGTLEAVTGFGKTRVAILAIQRMLLKNGDRTTLVVVPTRKLYEDWTGPNGHIASWKLEGVSVLVINTLIKRGTLLHSDLLILDEIHNYAADQFYRVFEIVNYKWILGLTATIDRLDGRDILLREHAPVFEQVTLDEAQREGYISKFVTYNVAVEFSITEREEYERCTNLMNSMFARFGHDFSLAKACMGMQSVRESYAKTMNWIPAMGDNHEWSPKSIAKYAVQWNRAVGRRKKLLYGSTSKLYAAKEILAKVTLKAITFSESTDFADELASSMTNSAAYHSNVASGVEQYKKITKYKTKPDKVVTKTRRVSGAMYNKRALEAFEKGQLNVIHTARSLDEGFDVSDIELALICSSTSAPRQNIQRTGRAVRFVANKQAVIINLYHPDTQDEKWLRKRQLLTKRAIWVDSVSTLLHYLRAGP